jgi:hypothetical protein
MARIRTIKPEFFTSETIAGLPVPARLTFIGLWTEADDYGNLLDNPRLLKGHIWPLDDDMTPTDMSLHIQVLVDAGLIDRYHDADGKKLLHIRSWDEHQKMNRKASRKHAPSPWETDAVPTQCADPAPIELPRKKQRSTEKASSADALSTQCGSSPGSGSGSGSGKGSGGGSGSPPDPDRLPNPLGALNGHTTTTTLDARIDKALHVVAVHLARQYARPGEEAAYRSRILNKPDDHTPELERIAQDQDLDPDEIAAKYLASRTKAAPPKPRCGICKGDPHPNGPIDCPALGG